MTPRIAIVGGGLTGAAAAIELLRTIPCPFDLVIAEPDALGRGLAYGKAEPFHLLNVRAGRLGILRGEPDDFATWAQNRGPGVSPSREPRDASQAFLPRRLFGDYVEARLLKKIASRPDVEFTHLRDIATGARHAQDGYQIAFERGAPVIAQALILATGYGRSSQLSRFGRTPFADIDPADVRRASSALFVGTGLTFVDEFLRLRNGGFRGQALATSRHGLLPEVHRADEVPRSLGVIAGEPQLGDLFASFRAAMEASEMPAVAAVDLALGLRSGLQQLWLSLDAGQQRRFLRHVRSYWNVVRHRLPPEAHAELRHSFENGMLRIIAARVLGRRGGLQIQPRGKAPSTRRFDLTFDCTGHRPDIASPLVLSLIRQGFASADPHRLGLSVASDGALISRADVHMPGLFALGPLSHGTLLEITAVPEIVAQAASMAQSLAENLRPLSSLGRSRPAYEAARVRIA